MGCITVTAGRYNEFLANGNIYDDRADAVALTYGDKVNVMLVAGKADPGTEDLVANSYAGGELGATFGAFTATAGYYNFKDIGFKDSSVDNDIWFVGAGTNFGDFGLNAMYLKGDASYKNHSTDVGDDGWTVGLTYKGAEAAEKGTWGLFANYYDQGLQTYLAHTTDANSFLGQGFKGYGVGANYTVAKNIVATVAYYDTEAKTALENMPKEKDHRIWTDLTFTF